MVLQQVEDELTKKISTLGELLSSGESAKAERAANLAAKEAALKAASDHEESCKTNKTQCFDDLLAAKEAQKAAKSAVASFAPEMQQAEKDLASAKSALLTFTEGALNDYNELLDHTAVVPPTLAAEAAPE